MKFSARSRDKRLALERSSVRQRIIRDSARVTERVLDVTGGQFARIVGSTRLRKDRQPRCEVDDV